MKSFRAEHRLTPSAMRIGATYDHFYSCSSAGLKPLLLAASRHGRYTFLMTLSGFLLAGGRSGRMGQDKALLPYQGTTLLESRAATVRQAAGSVTIVAPPERYPGLPYAVLPDLQPNLGPLGGIATALAASESDWNLILACDLPAISPAILSALLEIDREGKRCIVPEPLPGQPQPLCALYFQDCQNDIRRALDAGERSVRRLLPALNPYYWTDCNPEWFVNLNTPEDWKQYQHAHQ